MHSARGCFAAVFAGSLVVFAEPPSNTCLFQYQQFLDPDKITSP
jgi:hypothetical protein